MAGEVGGGEGRRGLKKRQVRLDWRLRNEVRGICTWDTYTEVALVATGMRSRKDDVEPEQKPRRTPVYTCTEAVSNVSRRMFACRTQLPITNYQ